MGFGFAPACSLTFARASGASGAVLNGSSDVCTLLCGTQSSSSRAAPHVPCGFFVC